MLQIVCKKIQVWEVVFSIPLHDIPAPITTAIQEGGLLALKQNLITWHRRIPQKRFTFDQNVHQHNLLDDMTLPFPVLTEYKTCPVSVS